MQLFSFYNFCIYVLGSLLHFFMFLFSYYKLHTHFQNWGYKGCIDAQEVGKKAQRHYRR